MTDASGLLALPGDCPVEVERLDGLQPAYQTAKLAALLALSDPPLGEVVYAGPVTEVPGGLDAILGKGVRFGVRWDRPGVSWLGIEDLRREMVRIGSRLPALLGVPVPAGVWEFPVVDWWMWCLYLPVPERARVDRLPCPLPLP